MHVKRKKKLLEPSRPRIYEIMPPSGVLVPTQRINIQLKFMPTEEVCMNNWRKFEIHASYLFL